MGENAFPEYYDCMLCCDSGVVGGDLVAGQERPFSWCACEAGKLRREREPNLIEEANAARKKVS